MTKAKMLFLSLCFVFLSACSFNKAIHATNVASLATQATNQYPMVEYQIKKHSYLFSEQEKAVLRTTAQQVLLSRTAILQLYASEGIESLVLGSDLLGAYQRLRVHYIEAIRIIKNKGQEMSDQARLDINIHYNIVKSLDSSIQALITKDSRQEEAVQTAVNLMGLVARLAMAAGA